LPQAAISDIIEKMHSHSTKPMAAQNRTSAEKQGPRPISSDKRSAKDVQSVRSCILRKARLIAGILSIVWLALAAFCPAASDPIVGRWRFFNKTTRFFREDGTSTNGKGDQDAVWSFAGEAPGGLRKYVVTYGGGKFVDALVLKNGDNLLDGHNNHKTHVTATRIGEPPPSATVPAGAGAGSPGKEIALAPSWMPNRTLTSLEMLRSLAFYSLAAIDGAAPGKEKIPEVILAPIAWRMPLDQAEKALQGVQYKLREYRLQNPCFPQGSILVKSFAGTFVDPNSRETFKEARLICDQQMRVISVELTCNHPRVGAWLWEEPQKPWWTPEPWMTLPGDVSSKDLPALTGARPNQQRGADGRREPYYDFIELKNNASTRQQVWYQVRHAGPGVTCIHTMLVEPIAPFYLAKVIENVRWYLPAPFARKLLDIAIANKPAQVPVN
jgi:hypothetical protein